MRRIKSFSVLMLLVLLFSVAPGAITVAQGNNDMENKVVFSIPIGSGIGDMGYKGLDEEMLLWGPTTIAVGEDGTFYIVDGTNNRIQHYAADGIYLEHIDLDKAIVGVSDIEIDEVSLIALDIAAVTPTVHRIALSGAIVQSYPVSKTLGNGLSGIDVGPQGEIIITIEGAYPYQLTDRTGASLAVPRALNGFKDARGRTYSARTADWMLNPHVGEILVQSQSGVEQHIPVRVHHTLAGLRYLYANPGGDFLVAVEELFYDGIIHIDQTIRHYDRDGNLLRMARVPLDDFYAMPANGIAVGPGGNVYALVPKQDRVEVQKLEFANMLQPLAGWTEVALPEEATSSKTKDSTILSGCRYRTTMMYVALSYVNNWTYLSSTNTDGVCSSRVKPRYITGAGSYSSVAYDAGGWDTVGGYDSMMYPGTYQAGDISFTSTGSCSRGVDCSGFTTRVWGYSSKLYTWTIPSVSTALGSTNDLLRGDVLNKSGDHVAVFASFATNGVRVYHSTQYANWDRVVYAYHGWWYFNGYTPRRYNNVCPGS